jgi:hypothetical protein
VKFFKFCINFISLFARCSHRIQSILERSYPKDTVFPRNIICETVSENERKGWFIILAHATLCEATKEQERSQEKGEEREDSTKVDARKHKNCAVSQINRSQAHSSNAPTWKEANSTRPHTKTVPLVKSIEVSFRLIPVTPNAEANSMTSVLRK